MGPPPQVFFVLRCVSELLQNLHSYSSITVRCAQLLLTKVYSGSVRGILTERVQSHPLGTRPGTLQAHDLFNCDLVPSRDFNFELVPSLPSREGQVETASSGSQPFHTELERDAFL